jgi:Arc/MetJ family transcription regulator
MTRTLIDIDDAALAAAARELGTTTKVDTVNRALAEIAGRAARMKVVADFVGATDDLADDAVMRGAWR